MHHELFQWFQHSGKTLLYFLQPQGSPCPDGGRGLSLYSGDQGLNTTLAGGETGLDCFTGADKQKQNACQVKQEKEDTAQRRQCECKPNCTGRVEKNEKKYADDFILSLLKYVINSE